MLDTSVKMSFGKYVGKPLEEVPRNYLCWTLTFPNLEPDLGDAIHAELARRGLPFGKHKAVALEKLPRPYLAWLRSGDFQLLPPWDELVDDELSRRRETQLPSLRK